MNDDAITYLNEEDAIQPFTKVNNEEDKKVEIKLDNEFINGLPEWDLEPPYELIKRSKV